jgi:thiol-disulfide isomerase/thioredoxin
MPIPSSSNVLVIEFWASWCGPCRQMPPHLTQLAKKYAPKGVKVVGISTDDDVRAAQQFTDKMGDQMDYGVAVDTSKHAYESLMTAAGKTGIPHAFILDTEGRIVYSSHPASPEFESALASACAKPIVKEVALPLVLDSEEELMARPAKELKSMLVARGISVADCFEKVDFAAKIVKTCRWVTSSPSSLPPLLLTMRQCRNVTYYSKE